VTSAALQLVLAAQEPAVSLSVGGGGSAPVKIFLLLTALSFASALLVSVTSFTRIIIVLSFLRQALGTQQLPPNQVMLGLALVLSFFVMQPTANKVYADALQPYLEDRISHTEALEKASGPVRDFMLRQTRDADLQLFYEVSGRERPSAKEIMPMSVVMPAFMISELKRAFEIGFLLFLPFLIIDLVVASVLMSMGMMMLPPVVVSLPFKLIFFVLVDGWSLVAGSLVQSYAP